MARLGKLGVEDPPAVSPDGRTVAVFGYRHSKQNPVWTLDVATGRRLGEWSTPGVRTTNLVWADNNRLMIRQEGGYQQVDVELRSFDRTLRQVSRGPDVPARGALFAAGGEAVVAGGVRPTVVDSSGARLVAEELRLAATADFVAVEDSAFEPANSEEIASGGSIVVDDSDEESTVRWPWAAGGAAAAGAAGLGLALRRRAP